MNPPRSRWPVGTLAMMALCVAGMAAGSVWALRPPEPDPLQPRRVLPKGVPMPSVYNVPFSAPPQGVPRDDVAPRSAGGPPGPETPSSRNP